MALYTDGPACTTEDLRTYESSILDMASGEGIELSGKIRVAQQEVGFELVTFLLRNGAEWLDSDRGLRKVVVTDPLRHWLAVHALAAAYRDAYYRQLNDRFKEKWAQYSLLTRDAKAQYFDTGVGVVGSPIAKAAAPTCGFTDQGALPTRTYFVSVAWANGRTTGEASDPIAVDVGANQIVTIARGGMPSFADGWSIYAGPTAGALSQQTVEPIAAGEWAEPESGIRNDGGVPRGQDADYWVRPTRLLQRG